MSLTASFYAFPIMVFSFMYQPNIPQIYHELKIKSVSTMSQILLTATSLAAIAYLFSGIFGYASFAQNSNVDSIMMQGNIFSAPYFNNSFLVVSMFMMLVGVVLSTPLSLLPCKDTVEELFLG